MPSNVTLTVMNGPLNGKRYLFPKRQVCLIGRAFDCDLHLPWELAFQTVSRHHCLLEIDPPKVLVRDLGSRNGTYVNGVRIEPYLHGQYAAGDVGAASIGVELEDGDEFGVAGTIFQVHVNEPARDDREPVNLSATEEQPAFIANGEALEPMRTSHEEGIPSAFVGCAHAAR